MSKKPAKSRTPKAKNPSSAIPASALAQPSAASLVPPAAEIPDSRSLVEAARQEQKRTLLIDHIDAIRLLRDEKRFTFRGIAEWLSERGIQTDHSAVYRAYFGAIPRENRDPNEDWSDVDEPE